MASASAMGYASSPVQILPLRKMRSTWSTAKACARERARMQSRRFMGVLFRRIGGIVHGDGVSSLKGLALRHHVTPHLRAGLASGVAGATPATRCDGPCRGRDLCWRTSLWKSLSLRRRESAPLFQAGPDFREGLLEFLPFADEDWQILLERVGIVGRIAHKFHVVEEFFEASPPVVEHDQAIS